MGRATGSPFYGDGGELGRRMLDVSELYHTAARRATFKAGNAKDGKECRPGWSYVNLAKARVIRQKGTSDEKIPPEDPGVRHFLS